MLPCYAEIEIHGGHFVGGIFVADRFSEYVYSRINLSFLDNGDPSNCLNSHLRGHWIPSRANHGDPQAEISRISFIGSLIHPQHFSTGRNTFPAQDLVA